MKGLRVLVLADAYPSCDWSSANPFIGSQVASLRQLGCELEVFVPTPFVPKAPFLPYNHQKFAKLPSREFVDEVSIRRHRFPRPPGAWFRPLSGPAQVWWLRPAFERTVKRFRPDIIHAHMATPVGYAAIRWSRSRGLPSILTIHGLDVTEYPKRGHMLRAQTIWALENADRVVAVSEYVRSVAKTLGNSRRDPLVGYIGVDTSNFSFRSPVRAIVRERLGLSKPTTVLCFAARLVREKGTREFAEVVKFVTRDSENVAAMVLGDGPEAGWLRNALEDSLGKHRTIWLGEVPHENMPEYFCAADILVHPSHSEGLSMVLLEAQACGLPVVASAVGGAMENVDDGKTGNIVFADPTRNDLVSGAVDRIHGLLRNPNKLKKFGMAGRQFVLDKFELNQCSKKLTAVYGDVLNRVDR